MGSDGECTGSKVFRPLVFLRASCRVVKNKLYQILGSWLHHTWLQNGSSRCLCSEWTSKICKVMDFGSNIFIFGGNEFLQIYFFSKVESGRYGSWVNDLFDLRASLVLSDSHLILIICSKFVS